MKKHESTATKHQPAISKFRIGCTLQLLLLSAGLMAFSTACTTRSVEFNGIKYKHASFGVKQNIGKLYAKANTNGVLEVKLEGYSNDQVEALGTVAEATAKGVAEGMK